VSSRNWALFPFHQYRRETKRGSFCRDEPLTFHFTNVVAKPAMWRCQWLPSSISILPMSSRNCLQVGRRRRISILPMSSRNKQMALRAQKREHNFHFTRVVAKRQSLTSTSTVFHFTHVVAKLRALP
jgi:hypothetical protein